MFKYTIMGLLGLFLLTSCSSMTDVSIVREEMKAVVAITQTEEERIDKVTSAHSDAVLAISKTEGATAGEKLLALALVSRDYADAAKSRIAEVLASFKRATLGTDVQVTMIEEIDAVTQPMLTFGVAKTLSENQKNVTMTTKNGDVTYKESKPHTTVVGDDNEVDSEVSIDSEEDNSTIDNTSSSSGY